MRPVDQTVFGFPNGNCFEACVASILEIPLESCKIFLEGVDPSSENDIKTKDHWWLVTQRWLRGHRYEPIYLLAKELNGLVPQGWSIISGKGPRELDHSTVGFNGRITHDPHPSRAGLLEVRDYICLIPLTPNEGGRPR